MQSIRTILAAASVAWTVGCLTSGTSLASLQLTEVDVSTGQIEITNIGTTPFSGDKLEFCIPFAYGTLENAFTFAPGEVRMYPTLTGPLNAAEDLWVYLNRTGGFGDTSKVATGIVWGSNQSAVGRVASVVSSTGGSAWASATDFVDTTGLGPGKTLQLMFPGANANLSSSWMVAPSTLGSFGSLNVADIDGDGDNDCDDANTIGSAIAAGTSDITFDLNGDGAINSDDFDEWLAVAGANNLGNNSTYLRGDANLDGTVDVADFDLWNSHRFSINVYCGGDFDLDGAVDISDYDVWNNSKFTSAVTLVPEPLLLHLHTCGIFVGLVLFRMRSCSNR